MITQELDEEEKRTVREGLTEEELDSLPEIYTARIFLQKSDLVYQHVGKFPSDEAFREWLNLNKGALRFDPETKMFIGEHSVESMLD